MITDIAKIENEMREVIQSASGLAYPGNDKITDEVALDIAKNTVKSASKIHTTAEHASSICRPTSGVQIMILYNTSNRYNKVENTNLAAI